MVLVKTADGKVHVVDIWGTAKFDYDIDRIFLSDGDKITNFLAGYSEYLVVRENIISSPYGGSRRVVHRTVKETVYGLNDYTPNKDELLKVYEEEINRINQKYHNKPDYQAKLQSARFAYEKMLAQIEEKEVGFITLSMDEGSMKKSDMEVSYHPNNLKKGISVSPTTESLVGKRYRNRFRV